MASKAYLARKERESKEKIAKEDREQQERSSKRQLAGNIIGSVLGLGGAGLKAGSTIKAAMIKGKNDPSWYKTWVYDQDNFAKIPNYDNISVVNEAKNYSLADAFDGAYSSNCSRSSVISVAYIPRMGNILDGSGYYTYGINEAITSTLAQIAKRNSRTVAADPDVMGLYLIASTELASALAFVKTNIDVCGYFHPNQVKIRDAILLARGVTPALYSDNIAEWKKSYQLIASRFNAEIAVPDTLSFMKRRVWVDSVIMKDADVEYGQYLTFKKIMLGNLSEDIDAMTYDAADVYLNSPQTFQDWANRLLDMLAVDSDIQTIVANIRNSIDESRYVQLPLECGEYLTTIEINDEVLMQFHNINTLSLSAFEKRLVVNKTYYDLAKITTNGVTLSHPTNVIQYLFAATPTFADPATAKLAFGDLTVHYCRNGFRGDPGHHILDFYHDNVSSDDVLVATRLHPWIKYSRIENSGTPSGYKEEIVVCGTELPAYIQVVYYNEQGGFNAYVEGMDITQQNLGTMDSTYAVLFSQMPEGDVLMACQGTNSAASFVSLAKEHFAANIDWMFPIYKYSVSNIDDYDARFNAFDAGDFMFAYAPIAEFEHTLLFEYTECSRINQACVRSEWYIDPNTYIKVK